MLIIQLDQSSLLQFYTTVITTKVSKQLQSLYNDILTVFILPHPDNKTENKFLLPKNLPKRAEFL